MAEALPKEGEDKAYRLSPISVRARLGYRVRRGLAHQLAHVVGYLSLGPGRYNLPCMLVAVP